MQNEYYDLITDGVITDGRPLNVKNVTASWDKYCVYITIKYMEPHFKTKFKMCVKIILGKNTYLMCSRWFYLHIKKPQYQLLPIIDKYLKILYVICPICTICTIFIVV